MDALPLLAAAGGAAALTVLHHAFWTWKLRVRPREDELLRARAADGWELTLGRCRPAGAPQPLPVRLVPGIAMNRQTFEFGLAPYALAAHLAAAGFDCFTLDLRGHGGSRQRTPSAPRAWNLD